MSLYQIARLDNDQLHRIYRLEEELDLCVIAMEPGLELAQLNDEQLAKVQQAENEMGVTLIVYKSC